MELDQIFGLPAHPLLVHAAVVLVPLAAVALVATGWRRDWRERFLLPVTLLALGGAVAAFLAKQSGEPLEETIRRAGKRVGEHPEQGEAAFVLGLLLAGACVVLLVWQWLGAKVRARMNWRWRLPVDDELALYIVALPVAALAIWAMVVAGHSGATLVWKTNK